MRVNTPSAAPAVSQTPETKSAAVATSSKPAAALEASPAVATASKPAVGFAKNDAFGLTRPPSLEGALPTRYPQDLSVRNNQARQLDQIAQGVSSGSITAQEAEGLLNQQAKINDYQKKAMSDGFLSHEEQKQLDLMQREASRDILNATSNGDRNLFARLDGNAQRQAEQIGRIADGRRNGNITNTETGELLRGQGAIADARGDADSPAEKLALAAKLNAANREIGYHSLGGEQSHARPIPPRPQIELPSKPDLQVPPFRGFIAG
jgi:hypothetical protein